MKRTSTDPAAPFGRDEHGNARAPYGLKTDGTPRLSNRGARPGQRGNTGGPAPSAGRPSSGAAAARQRRDSLVALVGMFVTPTLVGASIAPPVVKVIGPAQAMALAGDAVIIDHFTPPLADALVQAAEAKPSLLSWLDAVDDKAPYLALLATGVAIGKALVANHLRPDPRLASAGVALMQMNAAQMAADIEAAAAAMGINVEQPGAGEYADQEQPEPAAA